MTKEDFLSMLATPLEDGSVYISVENVKEYYEDEPRTKIEISITVGEECKTFKYE